MANAQGYPLVGVSQVRARIYGRAVTVPEADTMAELIEDCAGIPGQVRARHTPIPEPGAARPWRVDEACSKQVADLEDYGS